MKRSDANAIALVAIRSILEAAHDCVVPLGNDQATVTVTTEPGKWPDHELEGLDPEADGAWPPVIRLHYRWPGGEARARMWCLWWQTRDSKRHMLCITIRTFDLAHEIAWVTVGVSVRRTKDGDQARITTSLRVSRHTGAESETERLRWGETLRHQSDIAGLPRQSPATVTLCDIDVPSGTVHPNPSEVFERLVRQGLLKLVVLGRRHDAAFEGRPPFALIDAPQTRTEPPPPDPSVENLAGIAPLPGGIRTYRETLEALLTFVQDRQPPLEELFALMEESWQVTGATSRQVYVKLLRNLDLAEERDNTFVLTDLGEEWLADPSPQRLFEIVDATYTGMLDLLVLTDRRGPLDSARAGLLKELMGVSWRSENQVYFRRNWLLSLGLTERDAEGDHVTEAGKAVLADHADRVATLRPRIEALPDAVIGEWESEEEAEAAESTLVDDDLDLRPEIVRRSLGSYQPPPRVIEQCCAALTAGRHLLLVGPPGTGKTVLAQILAQAAKAEGYCNGLLTTTASADWTTFDTIGGYALNRDGKLAFRPGVFPRALIEDRWLLVDELNRADVDKAFGELMTVLSGKGTTTPYEDPSGQPIRIGPGASATYHVRPAFRVIATMNTWDKTSLFRLSAALQRRFATVHVGLPDPTTYTELLRAEAARLPALPEDLTARVVELFTPDALLKHRAIGPAVPLDMLRYLRHCQPEHRASHGLAEALSVSLLSQLEGLDHDGEKAVFDLLEARLQRAGDESAWASLEARLRELFTTLPKA